jgi:hypothetical protein
MRRHLLAAAVAVTATACSNANDLEERVRFVAAGVQAITPKELGGGAALTSAKAEGKTLVLGFRGIGGGDAKMVSAELKRVACTERGYRDLIDKGAAIRFEMTTFDGSESPSVTVEACNA